MSFSSKFILAAHQKDDGTCRLYLQFVIDRYPDRVPMEFYLKREDFNVKKQAIKESHPNAAVWQAEMAKARAKADDIASRYRLQGKALTVADFKKEFTDPTAHQDLIKYIAGELELKKKVLSKGTTKNHDTLLKKLKEFSNSIKFNHVNLDLIKKFKIELIADGNGESTIEKMTKILKQYLKEAKDSGISVPALNLKIKSFKSNRNALTELELAKLDRYYHDPETPANQKRVLQYFLFACYTGMRHGDVRSLRWTNVGEEYITFLPQKTKKKLEILNVPLIDVNKRYLPPYTFDNDTVFKTYAEKTNNEYLKRIAAAVGIKRNITFHTARHTFGSLMAPTDIIATKKMMGHSDIATTMGYVHTNKEQLREAMVSRFGQTGKEKTEEQIIAQIMELRKYIQELDTAQRIDYTIKFEEILRMAS